MRAPRAKVSGGKEGLRTKLMLNIERPALHIRCLEILGDAANILDREVNGGRTSRRIIECSGVNGYLLLERRVPRYQVGFGKTERKLIEVHAVSGPDRSRPFLKWIPGD